MLFRSSRAHTTPSVKYGAVKVYYRFHPLHGQEVFRTAQDRDGAVTVKDPAGNRLKIPMWMLAPDAGRFKLSPQATLSVSALLLLLELLHPFSSDSCLQGNLSARICEPGKEGTRAAASANRAERTTSRAADPSEEKASG